MSTAGVICFFLMACGGGLFFRTQPATASTSSEGDRQAVLELADRIFGAARARDAKRFASFFSEDPHCVHVINCRTLRTRAVVEETFSGLLESE